MSQGSCLCGISAASTSETEKNDCHIYVHFYSMTKRGNVLQRADSKRMGSPRLLNIDIQHVLRKKDRDQFIFCPPY